MQVGTVHLSTGVLRLCKSGWRVSVLAIISMWGKWTKRTIPIPCSPSLVACQQWRLFTVGRYSKVPGVSQVPAATQDTRWSSPSPSRPITITTTCGFKPYSKAHPAKHHGRSQERKGLRGKAAHLEVSTSERQPFCWKKGQSGWPLAGDFPHCQVLRVLKASKNCFFAVVAAWVPRLKKKLMGFPGGTAVGSPPADAGDTGSCPGLGRSHMPRSGWAPEPWPLSLRVWSLCSATGEATTVR
ncbi:uncharacterized protein LOC114903544 [Monodon monoceros]|uniref:uncharacterized protein LOC114903544 n=1 Tax=Monodon monoceros TaxID=40151 RepID=UPI0010F73F75|nr:uncharacterized protein LOC114903544 [Monodon monoceros]